MFVEERQSLILEELQEKGKVKVKALSERFGVTEDLIRKDLHALEKAGRLKREYGGAVAIRQNVQRTIVSSKKNVSAESKKIIASRAFDLLDTGMVVFLDICTANIHLARKIAQSSLTLTVVTNMLEIVNILVNTNINVICIGGELDYGRDGFIGPLAYEMLRNFRFDIAFMGAVGVDLEDGSVQIYMANEGLTKSQVVRTSKKACLLVEEEKLSRTGNYQYATLDDFDVMILDTKMEKEPAEELERRHALRILP